MNYRKPKGTRDLFGRELQRLEALNEMARDFFRRHGYTEIRTPTFEFADLFDRSIGETTDIVEHEIYKFEIKGKVYALRPEGTASVLRAAIENNLAMPQRLLYIASMYRRERPQKGRYREFQQIGIELLGENRPFYDAEVIELGNRYLHQIGSRDFRIEINSIGCPGCRGEYRQTLEGFLAPHLPDLCEDCKRRFARNFLRIFDCKNERCQHIYDDAPKITDNLCADCRAHYEQVKRYLDDLSVAYMENKKMVRGLDYYTRTVFEMKHGGLGAQDTVIAGGRYDLLVRELGGPDTPCVGWAMGPERLLLTLDEKRPAIKDRRTFYVIVMGEKYVRQMVLLRDQIQESGDICLLGDPAEPIKTQMKKADRVSADYALIFGEDEEREGAYTVKNMGTGKQEKIMAGEFASFLARGPEREN